MTPAEQRMHDEGAADARAGRKPTPPAMGGKLEAAYTAGYQSVPKPTPATKAAGGTKATRRPTSTRKPQQGRQRRPTGRSGARGRRVGRRAGQRLAAPVERQAVSLLTLAGTAAGVAFLYNLLVHAETTSAAITRITGFVTWLNSPTPIPYRK